MSRRLLLIVNPGSGTRQGARNLSQIIEILQSGGYMCTVMLTDKRMAASDYAYRYSRDFDLVVCVGGDGTFNETVNGLLRAGHPVPLGYIPTGSTNDFAASLKLDTDIASAAAAIVDGKARLLDVGRFDERNFSYVASFGAFSKTSYSTPQSFKNTFGHFAYVLSGVKDVLSIRSEHIRFELNGRVYEDDYIFGAISNSTSLGGVLTIDPELVDMNDGLFEILLIRHPSNLNELLQITNALARKQYDCDLITFESTSHITVTTSESTDWSLDGEKETTCGTFEVSCIHNALRIITGSNDAVYDSSSITGVDECYEATDVFSGPGRL